MTITVENPTKLSYFCSEYAEAFTAAARLFNDESPVIEGQLTTEASEALKVLAKLRIIDITMLIDTVDSMSIKEPSSEFDIPRIVAATMEAHVTSASDDEGLGREF